MLRRLLLAAMLPLGAIPARAGSSSGESSGESQLETGTARFQAGDFAGAIAPLERAHAASPRDADAALLLGIAYFRVGRERDAEPLLALVEQTGDEDSKASARVFLGLIADHRGQSEQAQAYYSLVARSRTDLGSSGRLLLQHDGPERWSLVGIVRAGFDSNVALQPGTTALPGPGRGKPGTGDGEGTLIGGGTVRPVPDVPLVLDETVLYRHYATDTGYDMLVDVTGATYTAARICDRFSLAHHFDASRLGGERYQIAHIAETSYRHSIGGTWSLGAHYTFAARNYAPDAYAGYTGLYHEVGPELVWGSPNAHAEGLIGYVFERQSTDDSALASTGHGGRFQLRGALSDHVELRGGALAVYRIFDVDRRDTHVQADATLFVDLSSAFGLMFGMTLARNASTDASFDTTKWTVFAGVLGALWAQ